MSLVLDASAAVDLVLGHRELTDILRGEDLHVPSHFDVETQAALRRIDLHRRLDTAAVERARSDLATLSVIRHPTHVFAERTWDMRHTVSTHDAAYVALAESLHCPLVTTDDRLARSVAHLIDVRPGPQVT